MAGFVTGVDRGRYTVMVGQGRKAHPVTAMKARELGRKGVVVGDRVALVGETRGGADDLARVVRVEPRASVLRRTADDTDDVERIIVANVDQLVVVTSLDDPPPRPRLIDRALVAAYDAGLDPAAGADQGRPDRAGRVPGQLRAAERALRRDPEGRGGRRRRDREGSHRRAGRAARSTARPGQRAARSLRGGQVDPGQCVGTRGFSRDRRRQRRDRPRPPHLDVGRRAAPAGPRPAGSSTPRGSGRSAWPTSTWRGSSTTSPTSSRGRPTARGGAPMTSRSARWTPGSTRVRPARPADPGWTRCGGCCAPATARLDD